MLKYKKERDYLEGLATILKDTDVDKVKLNIEELYRMSLCSGEPNEINIFTGLMDNWKGVKELGQRLRKGSSLSRDTLNKVAGIKE